MAVRRGDRFIIRFYSPIITIGGGQIIDALPAKHKRNREEVLAGMDILANGSIEDIIYAKAGERRFVRQNELADELGLLHDEMEEVIGKLSAAGSVVRLSDSSLISGGKLERMRSDIGQMIDAYHRDNPLADGMPRQELMSRLKDRWFTGDDRLVQAVVKHLLDAGFIEDKGKSIALSGFAVEYTDEQLALKDVIASKYDAAGIEMIKNDEILALSKDGRIVRAIQDDLEEEGRIVKVSPSYYISADAWDQAVGVARSFEGSFTLAEYRDRLGTSRKYASELLPAMDKAGITVFDKESRKVIK
jgi:selenocysteine-specific elongation factor